jgi:hypothetical protein
MVVAMSVRQSQATQLEQLLARMTFRERLNLLVEIGVSPETIMSIHTCYAHVNGRPMQDTSPLDFNGSSRWCRACFKWWYI